MAPTDPEEGRTSAEVVYPRRLGDRIDGQVVVIALRSPGVLRSIVTAWRPSLLAGFMGALASQFWFLAFALATVASVRTLALIEVVFAQAIARFVFKQATTPRELLGIAFIVLGVVLLLWQR